MDAYGIGAKYGESVDDFSKASSNTLSDVVLNWCNEGMSLMRKTIRSKARAKASANLPAQLDVLPPEVKPGSVSVKTVSHVDYWKFINYGVKGLRGRKLAIKPPGESVYKFKSLGTPPAMVNSFKKWAASAGIKQVNGVKLSFKGKKKKTALKEQEQAAKTLAVATKIGGVEAMNFVDSAINEKRKAKLKREINAAMKGVITKNIKRK